MYQLFPSAWMIFLMYGINMLITALILVCLWFTYIKMGVPGWKGIIPFYNIRVMVRRLRKPAHWFWIPVVCMALIMGAFAVAAGVLLLVVQQIEGDGPGVLAVIGFVSLPILIVGLVYVVRLNHALSKSFGHGIGFTVGLTLLPIVFMPILAFGESVFTEPEDPKPTAIPYPVEVTAGEEPVGETGETEERK